MCIILAKKKGIDVPSDEIIRNCFENNPDGAGLMYQVGDYVKIEKGFMEVEKLLRRVHVLNEKLDLKNKSFVIHFRIGTSGKNDKKTTHPFPITSDFDELRTLSIKSEIGMVHNGVIWEYAYKDSILSDTQNFVKDYVSMFYELNKDFLKNERVLRNLKEVCTSKLCFLDKEDNLTFIGDFITDSETGLVFSNTTYKKVQYTYYNYGTNYKYDDYDEWEFPITRTAFKDYEKDDVMEFDKVMLLSDDLFIQYDNGNLEPVGVEWYCIDDKNNLYEILDYTKDYDYIVNLVAKNVQIYDKDFKEVDFINGGYAY